MSLSVNQLVETVAVSSFNNNCISPTELKWHESLDEEHSFLISAVETDIWHESIADYRRKKDSLHIVNGSVLADSVLILPRSLRPKALNLAHKGHPGECNMISILRQRVWWPSMAKHARDWVKSCEGCTLASNKGPPAMMLRSLLPVAPMEKLAIDFNGPYQKLGNILILVIVDCYSRYLWLHPVESTSFEHCKKVFELIFGIFGIPGELRSDNGPPFSGREYEK